jgi:hypothetical protein
VYCEAPQIAAGGFVGPVSSLPKFRHSGKPPIAVLCMIAGMFGVAQ